MSDRNLPMAHSNPQEIRAEVEWRNRHATLFRASARTTPSGLVAVGILVSAILLSTAVLVRTALSGRRQGRAAAAKGTSP